MNIVDLDAPPRIPYSGWKVSEHRKGGTFVWNPAKVRLYLSKNQLGRKTIGGDKLWAELASLAVLNDNLLDYLFDNQHLIPEDWKVDQGGDICYIYFWGTLYYVPGGGLCVRYLCYVQGNWTKGSAWLSSVLDRQRPAAILEP